MHAGVHALESAPCAATTYDRNSFRNKSGGRNVGGDLAAHDVDQRVHDDRREQ